MELQIAAAMSGPSFGLEPGVEIAAVAGGWLHIVRTAPTPEGLAEGLREVARLIEAPKTP